MPRTRTLLALVLIPLLVFLVACGGDDDDDGGNANGGDQPASTDSGSSDSSDTSSDDDSDDSDDSSDDSDDSNDGSTREEIVARCPELLGMYQAFASGGLFNPAGGSLDADFETAVQVWQDAADAAPDEIKADMQVMADAFAGLFSALNEIGVDFSNPASFAALTAEQQAQMAAAFESLGGPEIEQAAANLDTWFTTNCQ